MALKLVEKKFDDFDGKELPDSTRPWKLRFNGKEAEVLVSPENRKAIEDFMGAIFDSATGRPARKTTAKKTTAKTAKPRNGRKKRNLTAVRQWLRENGYDVPERGVLRKELIDAYEAGQDKAVPKPVAKKVTTKKATSKSSTSAKKATTSSKTSGSSSDTTDQAPNATESAPADTATTGEASAAS